MSLSRGVYRATDRTKTALQGGVRVDGKAGSPPDGIAKGEDGPEAEAEKGGRGCPQPGGCT